MALVVDDSPVLALQLQRQLQSLRMRVRTVINASALDAATVLDTAAASVIFVDVQLLHGNGFAIARRIAMAPCPVVLISGTGRSTDIQWGRGTGAAAVLSRPVHTAQLRVLLQSLQLPAGAPP